MKNTYLDLMERTLSAYSEEHILRYFADVKREGLTEHGFPRLTANIGILISHGRRVELLPLFLEMMDLCCKMFLRPYVKAANEFSVREIISCILEVERAEIVEAERILAWKRDLAAIVPAECYNTYQKSVNGVARNWAIFMALSELFRHNLGLCDAEDFLDEHLSHQFQWLDENGMYMDHKGTDVYHPIVYDLVSRGLFALLLHYGYRGKYRTAMDECLRHSGLLTLKMQSANGELAFGGRSNQFVHNEGWLAMILEYEASRYAKEGNFALAKTFKSAVARALAVTEKWLSEESLRHIKNRFATETSYGCEGYGYFDKYMITVASLLYNAYLVCDDSIPVEEAPDLAPSAWQSTYHFHKIFLKSGGYSLEFDTNADPEYDATGLGRIHRTGAPSTICLSLPCPENPIYTVDAQGLSALSLCSGVLQNGTWHYAADGDAEYEVTELTEGEAYASASLICRFSGAQDVTEHYRVDESGVSVELASNGELSYLLPAFCFDGERHSTVDLCGNVLTVTYEGWICRYTADGVIEDTGRICRNRNGHYRAYAVRGRDALSLRVRILPLQ